MQLRVWLVVLALLLSPAVLVFSKEEPVYEMRALDVKVFSTGPYRGESAIISAWWNGKPVADVNVDILVGEKLFQVQTDENGEAFFTLRNPGAYFFDLQKVDGNIIYRGEAKLSFKIEPRLEVERLEGEYRICSDEKIGQLEIVEGEGRKTILLDSKNCAIYEPKEEVFEIWTPDNQWFADTNITVKVGSLEDFKKESSPPEPTPTIAPAKKEGQAVPTPPELPKENKQETVDYTLPSLILFILAIAFIGVGAYKIHKKRRLRW